MPHNTDTPAPKHHPIITILGSALMLVFLVQMIFPGALQWPVIRTEGQPVTNTAPQHFDGEVVSIVSGGDYVHPGVSQSNTFTGGFLVVRDKGGAEFVVHPAELNGQVTRTTTRLVKTVHNGKLSFSPWRDDFKVQAMPTGSKSGYDDYGHDYDYVAVDRYGNVTHSSGKEISNAEKDKHRESYATWLLTRVAQKFGANSAESKKLDEMKQNYKTTVEIIQVASEMLPELIELKGPEYPTPSKAGKPSLLEAMDAEDAAKVKETLKKVDEVLKNTPPPTEPKTPQ